MRRARPVDLGGYLAIIAVVLLATYGEREDVLIALVAAFPVIFILALTRTSLDNLAWGISATLLGVALDRPAARPRGLPARAAPRRRAADRRAGGHLHRRHGGLLVGRTYGRRKLAPDISPNKTVEGLAGGVVGGTFAFWFAGLYQDWLSGPDALLLGFLVALTAPVGDLFESLIKRDLEVKDTGRLFGAHGGVLDRLDAVFFTVVVAYYAAVALGYGGTATPKGRRTSPTAARPPGGRPRSRSGR